MKIISIKLIIFSLISILAFEINSAEINAPPNEIYSDYISRLSYPGEPIEKNIIKFEKKDLNGDGNEDWFLYDNGNMGSSGCCGAVYIWIENNKTQYCFAGEYNLPTTQINGKE